MLPAWGEPRTLPELHGDGSEEDPSVTEDRLTIMWSSSRTGNLGMYDVWTASRPSVTSPFEGMRDVTEVNGTEYNGSPEISADGLMLYFARDLAGVADIYMATRATRTSPWSAPVLRPDLSSAQSDNELAISPDGLTAIVNRGDGDFYELTRPNTSAMFSGATHRPELRITGDCASPTIDNGARVIYFHANDPRDLYVARRSSVGPFSRPELVTELATANRDADPFISADERYLIYSCVDDLCEVTRE